jgi:hypothetical protein
MSSAKLVEEAINATKVAEVVKIQDSKNQLRITHRVVKGRRGIWLEIVTYVLTRKHGWDAHVSKQYFMKDGKLRYAWNFIIQWKDSKNKKEVLTQVQELLRRSVAVVSTEQRQPAHQLMSYPLVASDKRNTPQVSRMDVRAPGPMSGGPKQKGAYKVGA